MNALFIILRISAGLAALVSFVLLCLLVFARDLGSTAKQGVEVINYTAKLFATAFTEGTAPKSAPWMIGPWQIIIGVLSMAMIVSVFTPGSRWFLHSIAVMAAFVMIGYGRMYFTGVRMEIVCLPFLAVWFGYYAMCHFYFWRGKVGG